jgi:predicted ATPase/class 3 adenylate cyclase
MIVRMTGPPTGTITLLFTDVEGSTLLLQRAGDAYADLLAEHRRLLDEAFAQHDGTVVDSEGDAFFVVFPSANDAAAAAVDAQHALRKHGWPEGYPVHVRIGLHTGEPRLIDGRYVGLDVHHAARVMAAGHGGQVLVSEATRALLDDSFRVRDLGEHRLKDLSSAQRLFQLEAEGLRTEFPPLKTLDNRPTNLPVQPNELIGRERELEQAEALLTRDDCRVLTLTGAGGAGKTRLALQLAANVVEQFANGVFFVSLAPVRDWELVVPTVGRTIGLRERPGETMLETVTDYLSDKQMLLVLDNFEQVLAAAPPLWGISSTAPDLRVLVTSRTPLRLTGERTFAVPPLDLAESVRLFVERAEAAVADFAVENGTHEAVEEICRRLDGLPLAIELAAARVPTLPPQALLRRLDRRLKLLTGGAQDVEARQRTLRATIEWSYELLPAAERTLFARLAVFVGGCRIDAADWLCDHDGALGELDVLEGLGSLVEKSLLRRRVDSDGEPRFWMLETIREYALEQLEAGGGAEELQRLCASWYADAAEQLETESRTGDQTAVFARIDDDYPNFRAALEWARKNEDGELMLRVATALWSFWVTRGYVAGGTRGLEIALELSGRRPARALIGLATLRAMGGSGANMVGEAQEALRAAEELGDGFTLVQAWKLLGHIQGGILGSMEEAERAWQQALAYAEDGAYAAERADVIGWLLISAIFGPLRVEAGLARAKEFLDLADDDPATRAWCCVAQAVLTAMQGDFEPARELLADGLQALSDLGLTVWAANTAAEEGFIIESLAGTPEAAEPALRSGYETLYEMGDRALVATIAGFYAQALCARGAWEEAARYSRAGEAAASPDDVVAQMLWRMTRAKILAHEGELERAEGLAREAVKLGEPTDMLSTRGDALRDLADVLMLAGRPDEALGALDEAAALYERKGNLASLRRVREAATG